MDLPPNLWPTFLRLALGSEDPAIDSPETLQRLITLSAAEGLLALMFADPRTPPQVAAGLQKANAVRMLLVERARLQHEAARRFVEIAGAEECLFFKGFDYRYRLYSRPELRTALDIDVYVPPRSLKKVLMSLREAGYPPVRSGHGLMWAPGYFEIGVDVGEVRVEIHRSFGHRVRASVDYEELWADRVEINAGSLRVACPSIAHMPVVHMLNIGKDELASPIGRFVDLWLMLRMHAEAIDQIAAIAKRWRVEASVYSSLQIVMQLFPDIATDDLRAVSESLLRSGKRHFLDRWVIPDRTARLSGHHGRLSQLWRKYWLTDTAVRRGAFAVYSAWLAIAAYAREAMHPSAVDEYRATRLGENNLRRR